MGNRGVLGLERLSRAQQREFWRLAARGKGRRRRRAKLSKGEAEGEHAPTTEAPKSPASTQHERGAGSGA